MLCWTETVKSFVKLDAPRRVRAFAKFSNSLFITSSVWCDANMENEERFKVLGRHIYYIRLCVCLFVCVCVCVNVWVRGVSRVSRVSRFIRIAGLAG